MSKESNITPEQADDLINQLASGIPPTKYVREYTSGSENLLDDVEKRYFKKGRSSAGKIRFVNGGWGTGKTHFLRLLREKGFENNFLVSTIELDEAEVPFNKFEEVYKRIVQNIESETMFHTDITGGNNQWLDNIIGDCLGLSDDNREISEMIIKEKSIEILKDNSIDNDFRRVIIKYMDTFKYEDELDQLNHRGYLKDWLSGEGKLSDHRANFKSMGINVNKMPDKSNSKIMLGSLSKFIVRLGYSGFMILIDESHQLYSTMRQSQVKVAHNNLLHLINNIEQMEGTFLVYAATQDFFDNSSYGIIHYGALGGRIGLPQNRKPNELDRIWNLDTLEPTNEDYKNVSRKIRNIYARRSSENTIPEYELDNTIEEVIDLLPRVRRTEWRILVKATVGILTDFSNGQPALSGMEHVQRIIDEDDRG